MTKLIDIPARFPQTLKTYVMSYPLRLLKSSQIPFKSSKDVLLTSLIKNIVAVSPILGETLVVLW